MPSREERPSPSQSATLFKIGTIKKGNDGNQWKVIGTTNGTHRWQKMSDNIKIKKNKNLLQLKPKKLKKIGQFNVEKGVVVGDVIYDILPLVKKGIYNCYKLDDNLLIVHESEEIDLQRLANIKWKLFGKVGVDTGTFGFFSLQILEELNNFLGKKKNRHYIPMIDFPRKNDFIVNTNMVSNNGNFSEEDFPEDLINLKYGVIASTGFGDGSYNCYIYQNKMSILIGYKTSEEYDLF